LDVVGSALDGKASSMSFASLHGATDVKGATRYHIDRQPIAVPTPSNDPKIASLFHRAAISNQRDLSNLSQIPQHANDANSNDLQSNGLVSYHIISYPIHIIIPHHM
jgi:hypothetical protein